MNNASIWIGFDPREADAYAVAESSIRRHLHDSNVPVRPVALDDLRERALYTRPTETRDGVLWDVISGAPMATEFACSRFLVPALAQSGWALFVDSDVLARRSLSDLFARCDPSKAVMVVKHDHRPENTTKMRGDLPQQKYARKNWSSVCAFNVDHPANRALTLDMINGVPGRDLHAFCWLEDDLIGELPVEWNWLVGHSDRSVNPAIVHFTDGVPSVPGHENDDYANEWRAEFRLMAA